jgi:hypothetical protein
MDPVACIVNLWGLHNDSPAYRDGMEDLQCWYAKGGFKPSASDVLNGIERAYGAYPKGAAKEVRETLIEKYRCEP